MTKLTTEVLKEIIGSYPEDSDEIECVMARQLLAYEQAAKTATAITTDEEILHVTHGSNGQIFAECRSDDFGRKGLQVIKLYAAPVLPKQPEHHATKLDLATIKLWNWNAKITLGETEENCEEWVAARAILSLSDDLLALLAQPVIPEGLIKAINRLLDNDGSRGCFDALEQHRAKTELERLLAAAQQNEPQNIPENIPAQPVSEPYKFHQGWMKGQFAYQDLFNAIGAAVVSKHPSIEISVKAFEDSMLAAAPAQDGKSASTELPNHFNLSTNSPVIPDGWKLVPIEPTAAMFHAFNDCDYGRKSMRERYIQMIEAAPTQESE